MLARLSVDLNAAAMNGRLTFTSVDVGDHLL